MLLIFGLGNPGKRYEMTRHNIGFEVLDKFAFDRKINLIKLKFSSLYAETSIKGEKVVLIKPMTFMNLSGSAVKNFMDYYQADKSQILVIYDDTAIDLAAVRLRKKGSAGGHNGMKDIIRLLGDDEFLRLRVGIGKKPDSWDLADFVTSKFQSNENKDFVKAVSLASDALGFLFEHGVDKAMNMVNPSSSSNCCAKPTAPQKHEPEPKES